MAIYGKLRYKVLISILILKVANLVNFISISLTAILFLKHNQVLLFVLRIIKPADFGARSDHGYQIVWPLQF